MNLNQPYYIEPRTGEGHLSLDGTWDFIWMDEPVETPDSLAWKYSAELPKSVYYNLFEAGILPDPYKAQNSLQYHWVDEKVWYYRRNFYVPSSFAGRHVFLCFDGVAYYCKVWVNGELLGEHEGMFGGPVVDIEQQVKYDCENEIVVEVKACNYGDKEKFDSYNFSGNNTQIVPWNIARDAGTTNADFIVVGIWNRIRIEVVDKLHISRPYLYTKEITEDSAKLWLEFQIADGTLQELKPYYGYDGWEYTRAFDSGLTGTVRNEKVHIEIEIVEEDGKVVFFEQFEEPLTDFKNLLMDDNFHELQFVEREILIQNPHLWYPNGMGEQPLYNVNIRLYNNGKLCDKQSFITGIRTFTAGRTPAKRYRTRWNDFAFKINGEDFFLKGINWMPVDYLYNIDPKEYEWCLMLVKNAGIQLLRVWSGGGMPETDLFYSLCDKMGIMVWQDHMIYSHGPTDHIPHDILEYQEAYNLYRIRNHTSLVIHCGGNEFNPYIPGNAATTFVVSRIINDLDPSRIYHYTTADRGSAHIYQDMDPVWYRHAYKELPFVGESGIHSFPSYNSLKELIRKEECECPIESLEKEGAKEKYPELLHHFTEYNPDRIPRMMSRISHIVNASSCTLKELCEASQTQAYEFYALMIQAFREHYPKCGGLMPWVFKRHWTTTGIQIVDGMGQPGYPYYAVKNTYAPVNVCLCQQWSVIAPSEEIPLKVKIFNQNNDVIIGSTVSVTVYAPDMTVASKQEEIWRESVQEIDFQSFVPDETYVNKAFLIEADLKKDNFCLSRTVYFVSCTSKLADTDTYTKYRKRPEKTLYFENGPWLKPGIQSAQKAALKLLDISETQESNYLRQYVTIKNVAAVSAYPVIIETESTRFYADDNFFMLEPGEQKTVCITMESDKLQGREKITISAWNSEGITL